MNIVLFYSGTPVPAMLEIGLIASQNNIQVDLIFLDRHQGGLLIDQSFVNYPITKVHTPYNSLDFRRFLTFPMTIFKAFKVLSSKCNTDSIVITSTIDTLLITRLFTLFRNVKIRHQVRDLHKLQLRKNIISKMIMKFESWLLKKCDLLTYSSPSFWDIYYKHVYNGKAVLLENLPNIDIWNKFIPSTRTKNVVKIGYIGIIRYLRPLINLVAAVENLSATGVSYTVIFAGGGPVGEIKNNINIPNLFMFEGMFEYSKEVSRLYKDIDLIFAVYDRFDLNCQIAMPTKFYESLLTKIPIMVSKNTYVGNLVEEMGIGIAVDGESMDSIRDALRQISIHGSWYTQSRARLQYLNIQEWQDKYSSSMYCLINK